MKAQKEASQCILTVITYSYQANQVLTLDKSHRKLFAYSQNYIHRAKWCVWDYLHLLDARETVIFTVQRRCPPWKALQS
jgi:hypothetical protein